MRFLIQIKERKNSNIIFGERKDAIPIIKIVEADSMEMAATIFYKGNPECTNEPIDIAAIGDDNRYQLLNIGIDDDHKLLVRKLACMPVNKEKTC